MSYDKETAMKPLTGEPFDECILNEREQRHELIDNNPNNHAMPSSEYCELRDAYIALINKNNPDAGRKLDGVPDEILAIAIHEVVIERLKQVDKQILEGTGDRVPIGVTMYAEGVPYIDDPEWPVPFKGFAYRDKGESHD